MQKILTLLLCINVAIASAQINTFPTNNNVGIATLSPSRPLQIGDGVAAKAKAFIFGKWNIDGQYHARFEFNDKNFGIGAGKISEGEADDDDLYLWSYNGTGRDISFLSTSDANTAMTSWQRNMVIKGSSGNVGIGTANPTEKLAVNGKIRALEIKVESGPWPDYVFEEDYRMKSLTEIEEFIKTNKHLPGIPNRKQVEEEGVNLGEMNRKLLEKVEELTLILIQKDKIQTLQSAKISDQEERIKALEKASNIKD